MRHLKILPGTTMTTLSWACSVPLVIANCRDGCADVVVDLEELTPGVQDVEADKN